MSRLIERTHGSQFERDGLICVEQVSSLSCYDGLMMVAMGFDRI